MEDRVPARLSAAEGRKFGLTVGGALVVVAAIALWRGHRITATIAVTAGVLLLVATAVAPTRLGPVQRAWMGLGLAMSKVTTPILMGVVYFVVLTPIALLIRVLGRNPLRAPPHGDSAWQTPTERRSDLQRQF